MSKTETCILTEIISTGDYENLLFQKALRGYHRARMLKTIDKADTWGRPKTIHSDEHVSVARSVHKARSDGNKWETVKAIVKAEHGKEYSVSHLSHIYKENKDNL